MTPGSRDESDIAEIIHLRAINADMLAALRRIDSICAPGESDPDRMAEMLAEIAAIAERAAKATA